MYQTTILCIAVCQVINVLSNFAFKVNLKLRGSTFKAFAPKDLPKNARAKPFRNSLGKQVRMKKKMKR